MLNKPVEFTIFLSPRTKKNSQQVIFKTVPGTRKKIPLVIPSAAYMQYENDCRAFMPKIGAIRYPVNVKAVYYMPARRRVDLTNLHEALHDILVKYGVLDDDNCNIVVSTDGSRVKYDKNRPRTEVLIEEADGEYQIGGLYEPDTF